jgi:group I intron endonuclease
MIDIYKIENITNKKIYIGQTCRGYQKRFNQHIIDSKKYNYDLYKAFKKYGIKNFVIEKINECETSEMARVLERHYIKKFNSYKDGYNMNEGDKVVYKHSELTKHKIRIKRLGMPSPRKGVKLSMETRKKQSLSKLGKVTWTKKWKVTEPNGKNIIIYNLAEYCRKNNLSRGNMSSLASNNLSYYKNYNVRVI